MNAVVKSSFETSASALTLIFKKNGLAIANDFESVNNPIDL
jgi:hypothetical protein